MTYHFTTNSKIISRILTNYSNTFLAFCELINNSLQASATEIKIHIEPLAPSNDFQVSEIVKMVIRDNGVGVAQSDFKKKILEIGTDVKSGGKGVGRFATFQIGSLLEIETMAYDEKLKKCVKTIFKVDGGIFESNQNNQLENITLDITHEEIEHFSKSYYQITINGIYNEHQERHKRLHKNLLKENVEESIFMQYPLEIFNDNVKFYINDKIIDKNDYVIGNIETRSRNYIDLSDRSHEVTLSFINYKALGKKNIQVFLRVPNNNIKSVASNFDYNCDIPDSNNWLVYVDSDFFESTQGVVRNLKIPDLDDDSQHLIENLKSFIDDFFREKFKEYFDFTHKLSNDDYYPYRGKIASSDSKSIVFNQLAYFIEKEHKILSKRDNIRRIVYPLVDKAINHGELLQIIDQIVLLKDEHIKKFNNLLEKTELEDVIQFSEDVAKKIQLLDFLEEIIYGTPSEYIKERSQLHKIIEKNLWIFGEQYNDTPVLFSDKSLRNNLTALRKDLFDYELTEKDENIINIEDNNLKDITDLFFFNEKVMDSQKQEVMVVELKRPSCKINQKELNQLDRYKFHLEKNAKFSKDIYFKLILISSDFSDFAASKIGTQDKGNPFLYDITKDKKIELYVYKWSELIHSNKRRLSYLSNILKTKDRDIKDVFEKDYPDIVISDLVSTLSNSKK